MDEIAVRSWFDEYLRAFAACGTGETEDLHALLNYYAVPLLVATDEAARTLVAENEVIGFARQMVDGMRATDFRRIVTINSAVTIFNATSALYGGQFARERADGSEISRLLVTYLIAEGQTGPRISAMAVHSS